MTRPDCNDLADWRRTERQFWRGGHSGTGIEGLDIDERRAAWNLSPGSCVIVVW